MNSFFNNSNPIEHDFNESGEVENQVVVNESVEVPSEPVQPEVAETSPAKADRRGKSDGGSDYVHYGDF